MTSGEAFAAMDRLLDAARVGPRFLARPEIADLVTSILKDGEKRSERYELHAFVVMPNHVHLLVTPWVETKQWLGPIKGFTAYCSNRILGRVGKPFRQDESYDRLVRTDAEFRNIHRYIENNPVKAGLADCAEAFPWSSAHSGKAAWRGGRSQD